MSAPVSDPEVTGEPPASSNPVRDRRIPPRGVLPRQTQTWLMVGVAGLMLAIILITGHPHPPTPPQAADRGAAAPTLPPTDRIRGFQQQLADEETRRREMGQAADTRQPTLGSGGPSAAIESGPADVSRRAEESLFADNVAFSHRSGAPSSAAAAAGLPAGQSGDPSTSLPAGATASLDQMLLALAAGAPGRQALPVAPPLTAPAVPTVASVPSTASTPSVGASQTTTQDSRHRLLEGTVIETVLLNRLDGTFAGPVTCLVTTPVYSLDRQRTLIPASAKLLGAAAPVQSVNDARLAVSFHRLVMPDGQTYSLDLFKGLNQVGETGLRDQVDRHYWQVFGASVAIGALSGLAQFNTRTGADMSVGDASRQSAGASLATSTARILDRFLNVLPTITIREGHRVKVYLTGDLDLPAYPATTGGVR